jgi:hypothetical protein
MLQGKEKKIKDKRKKLCLELAEGIKGLSAISNQQSAVSPPRRISCQKVASKQC